MKVPAARAYSLGELTSWAKQFLNTLQKEHVVDLVFEPSVQTFCQVTSSKPDLVLIENSPDMKQMILKLRASNRPLLLVCYGKLFTKEDLSFALEHRVYLVFENARPEDKKVLESIKRAGIAVASAEQVEQHIHSMKTVLLQGDSEAEVKSLLQEIRVAMAKLEKSALHNEYFVTQRIAESTSPSSVVPFHRSQSISDALTTVHDLERTGSMWVRGNLPAQEGKVEFLQGKIVAAAAGEVTGIKAIFRMFLWDEPKFMFTRIEPDEYEMGDHLNVNMKYVCSEGEKFRRNYQTIRRELPPAEIKLELEPGSLHPGTNLNQDDFSTLASIVEFGKVSNVLDYNPLPDSIIFESLIRLRKGNMIRVAS